MRLLKFLGVYGCIFGYLAAFSCDTPKYKLEANAIGKDLTLVIDSVNEFNRRMGCKVIELSFSNADIERDGRNVIMFVDVFDRIPQAAAATDQYYGSDEADIFVVRKLYENKAYYNYYSKQLVLVHEFGHALGLDHVEGDFDIMVRAGWAWDYMDDEQISRMWDRYRLQLLNKYSRICP